MLVKLILKLLHKILVIKIEQYQFKVFQEVEKVKNLNNKIFYLKIIILVNLMIKNNFKMTNKILDYIQKHYHIKILNLIMLMNFN